MDFSKRNELANRRNIEGILFSIGISKTDVARVMGLDKSSVRNDFRRLGGESAFLLPSFADADARENYVYQQALLRFLQLIDSEEGCDDVLRGLYLALGRWLEIDWLQGVADGIAEFVRGMQYSVQAPEFFGYQLLLAAVFKRSFLPSLGKDVFVCYLTEVFDKKANAANDYPTRATIVGKMAAWARENYSCRFTPSLGALAVANIDAVLATLPSLHAKVIRLRFRLGCDDPQVEIGSKSWTHEQFLAVFGMSSTQATMTEVEALTMLRQQDETAQALRRWITPTETLAMNWIEDQLSPRPSVVAIEK